MLADTSEEGEYMTRDSKNLKLPVMFSFIMIHIL